jgi:hypothetical protein
MRMLQAFVLLERAWSATLVEVVMARTQQMIISMIMLVLNATAVVIAMPLQSYVPNNQLINQRYIRFHFPRLLL